MILFYGLDSWHANLFRNFARRRLQKLAQGRRSWLWGWPGHLLPELKVHRDLAPPSHSARSGWYWAGPTMTYYVLFMFVVKWTLEKAANIDGFSPRTSSIPSLVSCSTTVRRPWRNSLVGIKHVFKLLNNWSMHRSKFCQWTMILISGGAAFKEFRMSMYFHRYLQVSYWPFMKYYASLISLSLSLFFYLF